jgi:hypothetical protein
MYCRTSQLFQRNRDASIEFRRHHLHDLEVLMTAGESTIAPNHPGRGTIKSGGCKVCAAIDIALWKARTVKSRVHEVRLRDKISRANKTEGWKWIVIEIFQFSLDAFGYLDFHSSTTKIDSSWGIVLKMAFTARNAAIWAPNVDLSNFRFRGPNSQKSHGARFWLDDREGTFAIRRQSKSSSARCAMALPRWRKVVWTVLSDLSATVLCRNLPKRFE